MSSLLLFQKTNHQMWYNDYDTKFSEHNGKMKLLCPPTHGLGLGHQLVLSLCLPTHGLNTGHQLVRAHNNDILSYKCKVFNLKGLVTMWRHSLLYIPLYTDVEFYNFFTWDQWFEPTILNKDVDGQILISYSGENQLINIGIELIFNA